MSWHGYVTSVTVEGGAVMCDVQHSDRINADADSIPVLTSLSGEMVVPRVGQKVVVSKLEDGTEYIEGVLTTKGSDLPNLSPGEMTFQFDDSTTITVTENGGGGFDVDISASGSVLIEGIPFDEHVHDYGDTTITDTGDGSGSSSTTTETTDPPH